MPNSNDSPSKLGIALLVTVFVGLLVGYYFRLFKELSALKLIKLQAAAVSLDSAVIPMLVFVPTIFVLLAGFIRRWQGKLSDKETTSGLRFIVFSLPLFLLVWGVYGWHQNRWLDSAHYQKCQFLTGSSFGAPSVWVREEPYCIQGAHRVNSELVEWAGQEARAGKDVSVDEFKNKIAELNQPKARSTVSRAPGE
ncbi:hypothetical protein [Halioxenophilus aromaticivorans]|uniref:hypothetical protein n=1 Tax=Halioxenophilus aromaticivorans TaxID=1306992 RepID=UPI0036F41B65